MNTVRLRMCLFVGLVAACSLGLAPERPQDDNLRVALEKRFAAPAFAVVRDAERVEALPVEETGMGLSARHRVVERPVLLESGDGARHAQDGVEHEVIRGWADGLWVPAGIGPSISQGPRLGSGARLLSLQGVGVREAWRRVAGWQADVQQDRSRAACRGRHEGVSGLALAARQTRGAVQLADSAGAERLIGRTLGDEATVQQPHSCSRLLVAFRSRASARLISCWLAEAFWCSWLLSGSHSRPIGGMWYARGAVGQFEQEFGFQTGIISGSSSPSEAWGITKVVAGGRLDRLGVRPGDSPFEHHGHGETDMYEALRDASRGTTADFIVVNVQDRRMGSAGRRRIVVPGVK